MFLFEKGWFPMACFLVPAALGIATTALRRNFPKRWHVSWLNAMIWGGVVALAIEHVAHQEIVPWPPFLTAMSSPADAAIMFREMVAVGIPMAIALLLAWIALVVVYEKVVAIKAVQAGS